MKQLEIGLTLILDNNEERQMDFKSQTKKSNLKAFNNNNNNSSSLFINTISIQKCISVCPQNDFNLSNPMEFFFTCLCLASLVFVCPVSHKIRHTDTIHRPNTHQQACMCVTYLLNITRTFLCPRTGNVSHLLK